MTTSNPSPRSRFDFPKLPASLPNRGNPLLQKVAAFLFGLWGWHVDGDLPDDVSQAVAIGAPHTSNWDFIIAMITVFAFDIQLSILGKHTIFIWPFQRLLRWMGLVATDRRAARGFVEQAISQFQQHDRLLLGIAPEGTRSKVTKWKHGFYYIAQGANVPIVPIGLDFSRKRIKIGPKIWVSGDLEGDMAQIQAFYADVVGKRPDLG
jgi:1-acyl-sn-glycerol-3-phosphate acyltransferase